MMTAPLRVGEPTTVNVALGNRAYDIVIGRGRRGIARARASPRSSPARGSRSSPTRPSRARISKASRRSLPPPA